MARAEEVIELENLLQCECRLLALRGHARRVGRCLLVGGKADNICEAPGDRQGVEGASPLR